MFHEYGIALHLFRGLITSSALCMSPQEKQFLTRGGVQELRTEGRCAAWVCRGLPRPRPWTPQRCSGR